MEPGSEKLKVRQRNLLILLLIGIALLSLSFIERRPQAVATAPQPQDIWGKIVPTVIDEPLKTMYVGRTALDVPESVGDGVYGLTLHLNDGPRASRISIKESVAEDCQMAKDSWLNAIEKTISVKGLSDMELVLSEDVGARLSYPAHLVALAGQSLSDEFWQEFAKVFNEQRVFEDISKSTGKAPPFDFKFEPPRQTEDDLQFELYVQMAGGNLIFEYNSKIEKDITPEEKNETAIKRADGFLNLAGKFLADYEWIGHNQIPVGDRILTTRYGAIKVPDRGLDFNVELSLDYRWPRSVQDSIGKISYRVVSPLGGLSEKELAKYSRRAVGYVRRSPSPVGYDSASGQITINWQGFFDGDRPTQASFYDLEFKASETDKSTDEDLAYLAGVWQIVFDSIRPAALQEQ